LFDNPDHDPCCTDGTSPYFVHLPTIVRHSPLTIYNMEARNGDVADASFVWIEELKIGDVSSQNSVINGRGVVNIKHGTQKGGNGKPKGYGVRSFLFWGDSGDVVAPEAQSGGEEGCRGH
jgi:hypothetical protein